MATPKEKLSVTLIQSALHWQNTEANLAMFEEKIWQIDGQTDLIVLPEMFTTGFTMQAEAVAEPMNLTTFKWLKQQAAQTKAVITGSYVVSEKGKFYNRLIWMQPDGTFYTYDKRHLFRMANEHLTYTKGEEKLIVEWKGWKFCPLICYDLRFPVWSRNENLAYDCLIYMANWPVPRSNAWDILLRARAVENLSYSIGVNRVGEDEMGMQYNGSSAVIDPKGNELFHNRDEEKVVTVELDYADLMRYRQKCQFNLDADQFELK